MNISFQTFTDVTLMVKVINCGWVDLFSDIADMGQVSGCLWFLQA